MIRKLIHILLLLCVCSFTKLHAQNDKPVFYEKLDQGLIRFYFDKYYYLVSKECEFKTIERVSKFDFAKQVFDGEFRDFAPNGSRILIGSYKDGKKEGLFQAFHPNGVLKWEVSFQNNHPTGDWKYYYPDGKPLLTITYNEQGYFIKDYWDNRGKQEVIDGEGNYEFSIPFEGFTEFGFDFYLRKGKVKNGRPQGNWNTYFYNVGQQAVYAMTQRFANGVLTTTYDDNGDLNNEDFVSLSILPYDYFIRAELFNGKSCSFDDYSNFYAFLTKRFNDNLNKTGLDITKQVNFSYLVEVKKSGMANLKSLKLISDSGDEPFDGILSRIARSVDFYFPTYKDNQPQDDFIRVSGGITQGNDGKIYTHSIKIERQIDNSSK
ncbi:toxin-antitoxin system YwqK family antitoxin [uncultured Sphingobacterium sp.]|jgi:antitoxin component YwqK of YwqJK toxin-antitoxin module|uniref:toxin-antitoxin system YwqK family antitoxin n=1 Tax=uncultured Sphingobacterium sp. TaxID=182688 RepID=UPI00374A307D